MFTDGAFSKRIVRYRDCASAHGFNSVLGGVCEESTLENEHEAIARVFKILVSTRCDYYLFDSRIFGRMLLIWDLLGIGCRLLDLVFA